MSGCLCTMRESCSICERAWEEYRAKEIVREAERNKLRAEGKCHCSWSKCICDRPELWPEPNYAVGQQWKFYADIYDYVYTIEKVTDHQLLLTYEKYGENYYHLVSYRKVLSAYGAGLSPRTNVNLNIPI